MFYLIITLTIIFSVVLALTILYKPFLRSSSNKYFAYAILIVALLMFIMVLHELDFFEVYNVFVIIYEVEWLFLFPVYIFFFYVKKIGYHFRNYSGLKLLYLPFLFSVILNIVNILERDFDLFSIENSVLLKIRDQLFFFENSFIYLFNFFILGWLFIMLKQQNNQENIKWFKILLIFILCLLVIWIGFNFAESVILDNSNTIFTSILCIGLSVFIYWISYHVIYREKLTTEITEINALITSNPLKTLETQHSEEQKLNNPHLNNFENLLTKEHIYRDPNLTRESVADLLGISPGYLSQMITQSGSENFSSYVNRFRVEEVKQMLCDATFNKYNIESIGLEAGFASKTTFYKTFKKFTGCTPSAFKKANE